MLERRDKYSCWEQQESLWDCLGLEKRGFPYRIAAVGAGGKTSAIYCLAREAAARGKRTVITTTTRMKEPNRAYMLLEDPLQEGEEEKFASAVSDMLDQEGMAVVAVKAGQGKAAYPGDAAYEVICRLADLVLVEADGSRMLPVKAPAPWEPVIPKYVDMILVLQGLSALGQPFSKNCHRPELAKEILEEAAYQKGMDLEHHLLDCEILKRLMYRGYLEPLTHRFPHMEIIPVWNQADDGGLVEAAESMAEQIRGDGWSGMCIIASIKRKGCIATDLPNEKKGQEIKSMKKNIYSEMWNLLDQNGTVKTAAILDGPFMGSRILWRPGKEPLYEGRAGELFWDGRKELLQMQTTSKTMIEGTEAFVEVLTKQPRLVILGGGHISLALCQLGHMLDYHVTVVDDRPEFANAGRFPEADQVICCEYDRVADQIGDLPNTYYVIVTRGHLGDEVCARQLLPRQCPYIGMIGSKAKVAATRTKLAANGVEQEDIQKLHAPIGLKIGGQTPAEISVSIAAEMIQVRSGNSVTTIEQVVGRQLEETGWHGIMATIVEKNGSSPRGVGSRMIVLPDGTIYGSIGGGNVEHHAVMEATKKLAEKQESYQPWLGTFDLSSRESAGLGMICGGTIKVLFEPVHANEETV